MPDISDTKIAASKLITLFDNVPEIDSESSEGKVLPKVTGRIVVEDIHFRYPTRPTVPVLKGLTLTVEPGTHVALVGPSGCGKSTIIQLLERFYDPVSGVITVSKDAMHHTYF